MKGRTSGTPSMNTSRFIKAIRHAKVIVGLDEWRSDWWTRMTLRSLSLRLIHEAISRMIRKSWRRVGGGVEKVSKFC